MTQSQNFINEIIVEDHPEYISSKKNNFSIENELNELLLFLQELGKNNPTFLIQIATIASQNWLPQEQVVPNLGKMFEEIPILLKEKTTQQIEILTNLNNNSLDNIITLKLLLDLREIISLLQQISYLQLLQLTHNIIPPGSQNQQLQFLQKIQELFQSWTTEKILNYNQILINTPLCMERQQFLQLEPQVSWELIYFLIELLKLPSEELITFQEWISKLSKSHLILLIYLLQMDSSQLLELKEKIQNKITFQLYTNNNKCNSLSSSTSSLQKSQTNLSDSSFFMSTTPPPSIIFHNQMSFSSDR